jgi:hypothetical protein
MFLLNIIDRHCPIKESIKNTIKSNFKYIQNIYCLLIVSYATYSTLPNNTDLQINALNIVKWQCILECLFCNPDVMVHHLIVLGITVPVTNSLHVIDNFLPELRIILQTEISTIFLTLHSIVPTKYKTFITINNILFVLTFMYTRLYQYSKYVIYNEQMYEKITNYYTPANGTIICLALHSLLYINIYWGIIIIKTLVKQINKLNILPSINQCEHIIKYMYFSSPIAACILYKPFENPIYFLDAIGVSMLCISSYEYHNQVSKYDDKKNILDNNLIWYYINDVLFIHIRSIFYVITHTNINTQTPIMYLKMGLLFISLTFHSASIYNFVKYIMDLKHAGAVLLIYDTNSKLATPFKLFNGLPVLIDSLIISFSIGSLQECNNIILITIIIFATMSIQPFYQMNHLAFHVLLLFQTIFLCQSNLIVNNRI